MKNQQKLQSNPLLKAIYDNLPAQVGLTEGIEVAERILAAIQKVYGAKETPEQVLRKYFKTKDNTDIHWMPEVIQAMQEYALQYQSVPVSEEEKNVYREKGFEAGLDRGIYSETITNSSKKWMGKVPKSKGEFLSSFLPKKP